MSVFRALSSAIVLTTLAAAQQTVSFPTPDGGRIYANLYGNLVKPPAALYSLTAADSTRRAGGNRLRALVAGGFRVLAIDFRGYGRSHGPGQADFDNAPFHNDVLAAVRYLKKRGVKTVSVVGGSFGGCSCRRCVDQVRAR